LLGSLVTYLKYISIFLAVVLPVIYFIKRKPDLAFWLLLNIFFDPGGYISYYFGGKLFLRLYMSDIVILPIIFCLYNINTSYRIIYKDPFLQNFLKVFLIFAVYFFIVYGGIIPYLNNDLDYLLFLQKNRTFLYYIIILICTYVFAMRSLKYFYMTTLFIGFIILSAFLVSLVTGLEFIPIILMERYEGSEMIRIFMYSWGLFIILFPVSFILFLFPRSIKLNIKYRKLAYAAGMLMVLTLLVALSRRNFISIPGTLLIIILLNSYIFRRSKAFALAKILVPLGAVLIIMSFTLPKYVDYVVDISQDTFQLLTKGSDTRGEGEYRVSGTGDLEITKKYIADNFLFGTGYNYLHWGDLGVATSSRGPVYAAAMDAAGEVPIYYIFFGYGLTGFFIMIFLYSFLIRLFQRLFSLTKNNINILTERPYEVLFIFYILYWISEKFTFSFWGLGTDFNSPESGIFIGIGFALLQKLKIAASNNNALLPSGNVNRLQESMPFKTIDS
jgi:hypothetical protein